MLSATEIKIQSHAFKGQKHKDGVSDSKKRHFSQGSSTIMTTIASENCSICGDSHYSSRCEKFRSSSLQERRAMARRNGLCYNCLGKNHDAQKCPSKGVCKTCKGRDHTLLHTEKRKNTDFNSVIPIKKPYKSPSKDNDQETEKIS